MLRRSNGAEGVEADVRMAVGACAVAVELKTILLSIDG